MWKNKSKAGPSNMSRNTAFSLPEKWGGRSCLLPVNADLVQELKQELGSDSLLSFVTAEFAGRAEIAFQSLNISHLSFANAWDVFTDILPLLYTH